MRGRHLSKDPTKTRLLSCLPGRCFLSQNRFRDPKGAAQPPIISKKRLKCHKKIVKNERQVKPEKEPREALIKYFQMGSIRTIKRASFPNVNKYDKKTHILQNSKGYCMVSKQCLIGSPSAYFFSPLLQTATELQAHNLDKCHLIRRHLGCVPVI